VGETYRKHGASAEKAEVHAAIAGLDPGLFPGAFCKVVADVCGDDRYVSIMHADGAGTKAVIAYIVYKESGRADVFQGIAHDSAVMNVDDLLCVGVTDRFLLSNSIGRNAHRVGGDVIAHLVRGYQRFADTMRAHGITVVLAGGETADMGDLVQTVVVDSTVFARAPREHVIDASRVRAGDTIVAFASSGRASYESGPNSGIGSNGFTLARHLLLRREYAERLPETVSTTLARDEAYRGRFALTDRLPGTDLTVADGLLAPTRTYAPVVKAVLEQYREQVSAIIHCTGGGQTKCLRFGRGVHYVKNDLLPVPPVFRAIEATGAVPKREMFQVFNMGHRMELCCRAAVADAVADVARRFGVEAKVIGEVVPAPGSDTNRLTIAADGETLEYGA
jgi:phosphoribosylformylglycinamidine cyclo-ligase